MGEGKSSNIIHHSCVALVISFIGRHAQTVCHTPRIPCSIAFAHAVKRFADGAVGGRLTFATHDSQLTSAQLGNLWLKTMWIDYFEIAQLLPGFNHNAQQCTLRAEQQVVGATQHQTGQSRGKTGSAGERGREVAGGWDGQGTSMRSKCTAQVTPTAKSNIPSKAP